MTDPKWGPCSSPYWDERPRRRPPVDPDDPFTWPPDPGGTRL